MPDITVKDKLLFRERMKIVRELRRAFQVEELPNYSIDDTPDPLVRCCLEELKPTRNGKLGLHYQPVHVPSFSGCLRHPRRSMAKFEPAFEETCDIYAGDFLPALVFDVQGAMFVYTHAGSVEDRSVMLIRDGKRLRFIYSLPNYLISIGAIKEPEED